MNDLISVIVPIYKVEDYLEKCINSILNQTYKNIEVILVDDGSPDKCGEICDYYATKDNRIKVIHKKNGGLSEARNYGIDIATGKYILFVDSDDFIDKNMCEVLIKEAEKNNSDIVICGHYIVKGNNYYASKMLLTDSKVLLTNLEMTKKFFLKGYFETLVVWNKLYKKELFYTNEKIRFPIGKLNEDIFTIYKLYYIANKITAINKPLYYYVQRKESIMGSFSEKNIIAHMDCIKEYFNFSKKRKNMKYIVQIASLRMYFVCLCSSLENEYKIEEKEYYLNVMRMYILLALKDVYINPYLDLKNLIKFMVIKFNLGIQLYFIIKARRNIICRNYFEEYMNKSRRILNICINSIIK